MLLDGHEVGMWEARDVGKTAYPGILIVLDLP